MSQHQIEEYSKLNEIRICENNKKSNDSIWLKLTEYLLK